MKPEKGTLEKLKGICIKNWNIYCMNPTLKNWQKHLKATTNYNRVFMWLEKQGCTNQLNESNN